MKDGAKDELQPKGKAYLEYREGKSERLKLMASRSGNLYAYYEAYCERHNYPTIFIKEFFFQLRNSVD